MFLCCVATSFAQFSGSGNGTENDPYLVYNETQLSQVSNFLNQEGVVFKLMKDLDLTSWVAENNPRQGWLPIGVESMPFMGIFIGNNHKVSGLMIKRTSTDNVGFFGYVSGATIENLTIEGSSVTGASNVGGFIGYASGSKITNCNLSLTSGVEGTSVVGGFIGQSYNSNFSTFNVEAAVIAQSYLGGFVGLAEGGNWHQGSVWGQCTCTGNYTGGFAGKMTDASLSDIKQEGNINGKDYTGGFVGCCSNDTFTRCKVKSDIQGAQYVSGFAGALENTTSSFDTCFHRGTITAGGDYVGGIVGVSKGGCVEKMESCSHFGDIVGLSYVGGIIGAILNTNIVLPTLSTYTIYTNDHSGTLLYTINETYINGTSKILPINNCTSIGNIEGNDWIGGLIGSELSSYSYNSNARTESYQGKNTGFYLFKDGVYTGQHGTWNSAWGYVEFSFSHSYYRNTVSYSLANNYYSGTIHGMNNVGGLCGYKSGGNIQNNYAYANIYGVSNVGGIVGQTSANSEGESYNTTTIKSNVAVVSAVSASNRNVGRIYGVVDTEHTSIGALGSSESNRALAQARVILSGVAQDIDDDLQNGTSIGPSALKLKGNYVSWGWNFDENWNILETESFPYKKYQAAPPIIESDLVSQATSISGKSFDGGTVYLYYKDRDAVSTECSNYKWNFNTEALQSGAIVQIYSDVEGLTPSYYTTATVGYPGSGTEDDPWRIYTAEDLQGASNRGYYKVMNDIDLTQWINENSPEKGWIPIGRNSGDATYIDGNHRTISGLWIDNTENFNGLFSNFSTGQIKNLNVEVAEGKKVKGGDYTGILIGRNANGSLENCSVKGDVEGTIHVGGVVGYVENSTISSVIFEGNVASNTGDASIGGIAGHVQDCVVSGCRSESVVSVSGNDSRVGGMMGYSKNGSITNSITNTTLTATGTGNYVGGLVGYSETPITLSISTGSVSATGGNSYSGGLVGYALSPVSNSYSTANTTGTQFTAGLVGYTFSTIDKCYAKGDVNGVMYGGGLVGELDGQGASLTNSVACNNILSLSAQSSWGSRVIGGFKNGAAEPNQSNYALSTMQVSLNNVPQTKTDDAVEGIAKTPAELMQADTYIGQGWDFTEVWGIDEGEIYPYLLWEIDINPVADISFDKTSMLIAVGKSETISANVLPMGATNKRLEWKSSNTAVATVDDGVVTAIAVGTATITATSTDGSNITATCQVTVTANKDAAIAELQAIVDRAQSLYDNSTEGENIGEYAAGARAELLAVINSVNGRISSTMSDEAITQCTNEINAAIELFESKKVTAGEDTDIAQLDNTLYVERIEAAAGQQIQLSVKMKNTVAVQGYQFDLYLPAGVTVATDADGFALAELSTARTTKNKTNYFDFSFTDDGALRVLCGSSKGYTFSGNDGEVAIITLNIAQDITEGEHPIILKSIKLSDPSSVPYRTEYVKSTLVISSYTLGDVNADGSVDVADFIAIANHILGNTIEGFVEKAADVNEDGAIDVADFIGVANMILSQPAAGSRRKAAPLNEQQPTANIDDLDNAIYVVPVGAVSGAQQVLSVRLKNAAPVAGFEFTLQLPEGMTIATDADDKGMAELSTQRTTTRCTNFFESSLQSSSTLKVLCGTSKKDASTGALYAFSGNDGEVARITVNVADGTQADTYPVKVKDAVLSTPDAKKMILPVVMMSESTTGVSALAAQEAEATYYDLQGRRVLKPAKKSLYIVNGKKEVIR